MNCLSGLKISACSILSDIWRRVHPGSWLSASLISGRGAFTLEPLPYVNFLGLTHFYIGCHQRQLGRGREWCCGSWLLNEVRHQLLALQETRYRSPWGGCGSLATESSGQFYCMWKGQSCSCYTASRLLYKLSSSALIFSHRDSHSRLPLIRSLQYSARGSPTVPIEKLRIKEIWTFVTYLRNSKSF